MSDITDVAGRPGPLGVIQRLERWIAKIPEALPLLALRFALAIPFFYSGLTKWNGFLTLSDGAHYLFEQEFRLHILGQQYPYPAPVLTASPLERITEPASICIMPV